MAHPKIVGNLKLSICKEQNLWDGVERYWFPVLGMAQAGRCIRCLFQRVYFSQCIMVLSWFCRWNFWHWFLVLGKHDGCFFAVNANAAQLQHGVTNIKIASLVLVTWFSCVNHFRDLCVSTRIGWVHVFRGLQFGGFSQRPWLNFCRSVDFKGLVCLFVCLFVCRSFSWSNHMFVPAFNSDGQDEDDDGDGLGFDGKSTLRGATRKMACGAVGEYSSPIHPEKLTAWKRKKTGLK